MNRLSHIFLSLATFLSAGTAAAHTAVAYAPYSPPPHHSYIIPASIKGVSAPAMSLDGEWDVKIGNKARWHKVSVPGELATTLRWSIAASLHSLLILQAAI